MGTKNHIKELLLWINFNFMGKENSKNINKYIIKPPKIVTKKALIFIICPITGSTKGLKNTQLIKQPLKIPPKLKNIIGIVLSKELSLMY